MSLRPSLWRESYCASLFRNLVSVRLQIEAVQNGEVQIETIAPFPRTDHTALYQSDLPSRLFGSHK